MSTSADPAGPVDCRVSRQVVSYGAGTNSTAMVCEMVRRGEPFAAVVFADTGGERPETYAHLLEFSEWLTARGYPAITTVRQTTKVGNVPVTTLEAECLAGHRLPGIAYGFGSCSDKWKQRPFRAWLKQTGWQDVTVCIGFDADEPHRAERGDQHDSGYAKRYPLIEWDMGRDECIAAIDAAGVKRLERAPVSTARAARRMRFWHCRPRCKNGRCRWKQTLN